jgi:TonB-linked SusC/RagA family outer membrane protein
MNKQILLSMVFVLIAALGFAQQKTISGVIKAASDNSTLLGASVIIKGTNTGVSSNIDGEYSIKAEVGDVLVFSYVGYLKQEITVALATTIDVSLVADAESLAEVIVVAYGTTTKEAFTGSVNVITEKELEKRSVTSAIAAIEGNATGVQFVSNGSPGGSPSIVIRGVGTLNGSTDPLIILDGSQYAGALNSINQEDIASFTVLKDAASTALYGNRAANGVIIITTKKGNKGGIKTSFSSQIGQVTNGLPLYDQVNPGQYYEAMWQALRNSPAAGGSAQFATDNIYNQLGYNPFNVANNEIVGIDGRINPNAQVIYNSLDWFDVLQQTGVRQNYNMNVSGGGENHTVFFSASYLDEESYVITSGFDRFTARLNAEFQATKSLKFGGNINTALSNTTGPLDSAGAASIVNPFSFAQGVGSIYPVFVNDLQGNIVRDAAGNPIYDNGEGFPDFNIGNRPRNQGRHALQELVLNKEFNQNNTYGIRLFGEWEIIDNLKLRATYSRDINELFSSRYENNLIGDAQPTGRLRQERGRRDVTNFNQVLTYAKSFGDHNLDLTAGHESYEQIFSSFNGLSTVQTATGIFEFDNFSNIVTLAGATFDRALDSYFFRANYNYQNKYYLSASARRDGSSVFTNSKWGTFYSVGGSWRIDQEKFMDNVSSVNALKLRSSWGQVGNDNLGDSYLSQARFQLTSNAATPAILFSALGNVDLEWETTTQFDVAVEFGLFDNFLEGSIEYYNKATSDLLFELPIAPSNGINITPTNIGDIENRGLELALTAHFFKKQDFNWDLTLQASTFKNEITSIPDPFINGTKRWAEGRSRFDWYLLRTAGVDPANGDQLFYLYTLDDNGESIPTLNPDGSQATTNDWRETERAYTGDSSLPDLLGSVSNTFTYKNFDLSVLITYGIGGKILDGAYSGLMHSGTYGSSFHPDILRAWQQPGDITDVPRLENGNVNLVRGNSDRFLTDASFWALRNVNLGYNFDGSVINTLGIDKLRVYATGENLFIKSERTGLNPQYNLAGTTSANDFAPNRILSLGLNLSF